MQGENLSHNTHTHHIFSGLDFVPPSSVGNNSAAMPKTVSAAGSFVWLLAHSLRLLFLFCCNGDRAVVSPVQRG